MHNNKMRAKDEVIKQFFCNGLLLEETLDFEDVNFIINFTLADEKAHDYAYSGQTLHTLAFEYIFYYFDKDILSYCSPQLFDILTSTLCINSPFIEYFGAAATTAYDISMFALS